MSKRSRGMSLLLHHIPAVIILLAASVPLAAHADAVKGVRCDPTLANPIAARGRVVMIPLDAERHGDRWPARVTVRFERGGSIEAPIAWIHRTGRSRDVHWTTPPGGLAARTIEQADDSSLGVGAPHVVLRVPDDAGGTVRLLNVTLTPTWCEVPHDLFEGDSAAGEGLAREIAPDRPDPDSPFEHWRWVLLAGRLGQSPPPPAGSEIERMVAEYHADLWRIALGRLAEHSPGVARQCRDLLTWVCQDGDQPFAAWVTDSAALSSLLRGLLDFSKSASSMVDEALAWADSQDMLFLWPDGDTPDQVRLAVVNGGHDERVMKFRWVHGDAAMDEAEVPGAAVLPPVALTRVAIDRPAARPPSRLERSSPVTIPQLEIECGAFRRRFHVRPGEVAAAPPGVFFGPLLPPLTLDEAQRGEFDPPAPEYSTNATLRRADGRWEVFVECFRPREEAADASADPLSGVLLPKDLRGVEAVTVFLGEPDQPVAAISISESGAHRVWFGGHEDALEVQRRVYADRWMCRVVLPDAWLGYPRQGQTMLGMMRTHAGGSGVETAPNPAVPWNVEPGRILLDLTRWTDLPPFGDGGR